MANVKIGNQVYNDVEKVKLNTEDGGEAIFSLGDGGNKNVFESFTYPVEGSNFNNFSWYNKLCDKPIDITKISKLTFETHPEFRIQAPYDIPQHEEYTIEEIDLEWSDFEVCIEFPKGSGEWIVPIRTVKEGFTKQLYPDTNYNSDFYIPAGTYFRTGAQFMGVTIELEE